MDTAKKYHDSEGDVCSIWEAVRREPDWAANIIQDYEKTTEALQSEVQRLKGVLSEVKADLLRRGKKDNQGIIVVDLSSSVWRQLCDVLAHKQGEE